MSDTSVSTMWLTLLLFQEEKAPHGSYSGPRAGSAAAERVRGHAWCTGSDERGEDEDEGDLDGQRAGGPDEQELPGNPPFVSQATVFLDWLSASRALTPAFSPQDNNGLPSVTDRLEGSASVVTSLEGYNNLISDRFGDVSQIKAEISSLTGYLDHWRQDNCHEQRPKVRQRRKSFSQTVTLEALRRVKEFLKLLLENLDHLEKC